MLARLGQRPQQPELLERDTGSKNSQVLLIKPRAEPTFAATWKRSLNYRVSGFQAFRGGNLQQNYFHFCLLGWKHHQHGDSLCGISRCFILQKFLQTFDSLAVWEGSCSLSFALRAEQERAQNLKQRPMSLTCVHVSPINQPRDSNKFMNLQETLNEPGLHLQVRCTVLVGNNSQHAARRAR